MAKTVYHKKTRLLLIETDKYNTNGIMSFRVVKSKPFDNETDAVKYSKRYYPNHTFEIMEY